jgi:glutaredoxin-like protein NrdH
MIKVYGKGNGCVNCNIAKDMLERNNIEYKFIDITEDDEALKLIRSLGYRQVPVIENEGDWYTLKTLDDLLFTLGY